MPQIIPLIAFAGSYGAGFTVGTLSVLETASAVLAISARAVSAYEDADRIKARAIRRCGELAKQIEPKRGGDRKSNGRVTTPMISPREATRQQAGLSTHQLKQAIHVANVPREDFERQAECSKATKTKPATSRRRETASFSAESHSCELRAAHRSGNSRA